MSSLFRGLFCKNYYWSYGVDRHLEKKAPKAISAMWPPHLRDALCHKFRVTALLSQKRHVEAKYLFPCVVMIIPQEN